MNVTNLFFVFRWIYARPNSKSGRDVNFGFFVFVYNFFVFVFSSVLLEFLAFSFQFVTFFCRFSAVLQLFCLFLAMWLLFFMFFRFCGLLPFNWTYVALMSLYFVQVLCRFHVFTHFGFTLLVCCLVRDDKQSGKPDSQCPPGTGKF